MKPKNFPLQNKFTWGFELEGKFANSLINILQTKKEDSRTALTDFHVMYDGSVSVHAPPGFDRHEEVSLGIFPTLHTFYKYLKEFNPDNYRQNTSCGMHIHLKEKDGNQLTENIYNWKFIDEMQRWAMDNLPRAERTRMTDGTYCKKYPNYEAALNDLRGLSKYRAIARRRHTIELRLFSTRHRETASKAFLEKFLTKLNEIKDKPVKRKEEIKTEMDEEEMELPSLDLAPEEIEITDREINRTHQITNTSTDTATDTAEEFADNLNARMRREAEANGEIVDRPF